MKLRRIDSELVRRGLAKSRSAAAQMIEDGRVKLDGQVVVKPARQMDPAQAIVVEESDDPEYVSRGAHKLAGALDALGDKAPLIEGRRALDAGASTGGFTDVLLRRGAASVVAVDVGYGQLAWKLQSDPRVEVHDRTNVRTLDPASVAPAHELVVGDMSFISLCRVLPNLKRLLADNFNEMICLIKPQFEAGKEFVEKGGVVRDKSVHAQVIKNVIDCSHDLGYGVLGLTFSSIKGPKGNIEYLIHIATGVEDIDIDVDEVVNQAHEEL